MRTSLFPIIASLILIPVLLLILWRIRLKKLAAYHSPILGKVEVWQKYNGEKMLTINSYVQGVSTEQKSIQKSYWFAIAEKAVKFCRNKKDSQVLMLGLGANTISNLIGQIDPHLHQVIIEIDKFIIQACQKFFKLNGLPNYQLLRADAYKLFDQKKAISEQFDVIIVDIFTGNPPYISLKSNEPSFIEKLLPYIKTQGMIIFNRPAHNEQARSDGKKLEEYLKTLFRKTEIFDIRDPRGFRNYVITGSQKLS